MCSIQMSSIADLAFAEALQLLMTFTPVFAGDMDPARFNPDRMMTPEGQKPGAQVPFGWGNRCEAVPGVQCCLSLAQVSGAHRAAESHHPAAQVPSKRSNSDRL
jgi:hypothetical protein